MEVDAQNIGGTRDSQALLHDALLMTSLAPHTLNLFILRELSEAILDAVVASWGVRVRGGWGVKGNIQNLLYCG
jgi:hypothetical protein